MDRALKGGQMNRTTVRPVRMAWVPLMGRSGLLTWFGFIGLALVTPFGTSGAEERSAERGGPWFVAVSGGVAAVNRGGGLGSDVGLSLAGLGVEGSLGLYVVPSMAVTLGAHLRETPLGSPGLDAGGGYRGVTAGVLGDLGAGLLLHGLLGFGTVDHWVSGDLGCFFKATAFPSLTIGIDKMWEVSHGYWLGIGASAAYSHWGDFWAESSCLGAYDSEAGHHQIELFLHVRASLDFSLW